MEVNTKEPTVDEMKAPTGGGGGVDEDASMATEDAPEASQEPAWMTDMRQAAARQRDITMTAKDVLTAYLTSGGAYVSCDQGHVEKAYKIAALFVDFGEGLWLSTMGDIRAKYSPPSNIVGIDGQPIMQ